MLTVNIMFDIKGGTYGLTRRGCPWLVRNFTKCDSQETSDERPALAASYHVRCKLDGGHYLAIFATSEMDKVSKVRADLLDNNLSTGNLQCVEG